MNGLPLSKLGDTGIMVSCLGLGTVKFGRNQEVKYPQGFQIPGDREVENLLQLARDLGINFLDTAPAYGSSEQRLGRLLRDREHWIIGSKVGEEFLSSKSQYRFDRESVQRSLERSLRDLRTDYLDLVLIHSDGNDMHILDSTDCVETLVQAKERGLVRAIGLSGKTVEGGIHALELMDVAMVTYNRTSTVEEPVIDYALAHNKGILIKKAFDSGHIAKGDEDSRLALEFALTRAGVSSVIVGTINPRHLQSNVQNAVAALAGES
ncbi:MAG: aldo/keto reductase [Proteobacteria bacterium]|nr:aldo/keto reductase [Pseudomonadota bacterium]MDA0928276.1 aldo/keto reductase [Pseudomonadota bacterium]